MSSNANTVQKTPSTIAQNVPVAIEMGRLRRSARNMRTINPKDSQEDRELLASVRSKGIIQNLCAYPVGDTFEVPAGGRRFGALEYLLNNGEIGNDFLVYCLLISEDDATDTSLIENYQRKAPHAADVYTAFSALVQQGRSVAAIAKTHGIEELQVEKYLRLGKVNKTLFKHFRNDRFSLDQVIAFASTPDAKLQLATFKAMGQNFDARPDYIRAQLQANRMNSESALAKFVTVEAYEKAGGSTEKDLFTDTTVFCNVELLVKIAEEKLEQAASELDAWKWTKTSMDGAFSLHEYQRLPSKKLPVSKPDADRLASLEKRMQKIESVDDDKWTDDLSDELDTLETYHHELQDKIDRESTGYSDKNIPFAGCLVTFSQLTGEIEIHKGLMTKADLEAFRAKDTKKDALGTESENQEKATVVKLKPELSARLSEDLGLYRRSAIKAELASNTAIAVDLLHFQLCLNVIGSGQARWCRVFNISTSEVNDESSIGDYKSTVAAKSLADRYAKLDTGWMALKSEAKQFEAFRSLSSAKRLSLVAYCAAMQLQSGATKTGSDKLIDAIAKDIEIDFRHYFRPTADNFFGRLTKPLLLGLGKKWYGASWVKTHTNDSKKSLVDALHQLFHGAKDALSEKECAIQEQWLPAEIDK